MNLQQWRKEILLAAEFADENLAAAELSKAGIKRMDRYIELAEWADERWERTVFDTMLETLRDGECLDIFESFCIGKVLAFPPETFGDWMVAAMPRLISRAPEHAADFLSLMINNHKGPAKAPQLGSFRRALAGADPQTRDTIVAFVRRLEQAGGILHDKRGHYRV